jgi:tRNA threonylcarbamoyladenosine biosynthesis protein TsaE
MITKNFESTIEYAKEFAKKLKGGEVIGLIGDLGCGKTTFVKGLAEELRVNEGITSPTFVILKKYHGKIKDKKIDFVHIDAYRAESIDDIKSVGIEDYLAADNVVMVIEWAERIKEILPENTIYIKFKHISESTREIVEL